MILCRYRNIVKSHLSHYLKKPHLTLRFFSSSRQTQSKRTIPTSDHLLNKHQFSRETASKVSLVLPHLKDPENVDSILLFLKESGFSKTQIEQVIESKPKVLCSKLERAIKPTIKIFVDFGFSPADVAEFVSAHPHFLNRKANANNQLMSSLVELRGLLGSILSVSDLHEYRQFLLCNLERNVLPNVEILQSCGIRSSQLLLALKQDLISFKPETLKQLVKRVDEMGVCRESKMFIYALHTVGAMSAENWECKMDLFRSIGFSEYDIVSVFRRLPNVFTLSKRKINEMAEVVLGSGLYDTSFIVSHPQILIYSVERIKPRLQVLKILKGKDLLNLKPKTNAFTMSEKLFIDRYVLPFAEKASELLGMVCEAKNKLKVAEKRVKV